MKNKLSLLGREIQNSKVGFVPGMELLNANGLIDPSSLGYQYTIQTTTQIRSKVVKQKFYTVPVADFIPVVVGQGAWMENLRTNLVYDAAGDFSSGIISTAAGPSQLSTVEVGIAPVTTKIVTWAKGYLYTNPEVAKALASNNWDVVSSKMEALKRNWDLGLQQVAFLGLRQDLSGVPGLLTNTQVNSNTAVITANISGLTATNFNNLVATILAAYAANANYTVMPNRFIMPLNDYLGMASATSGDFPIASKLQYLTDAFRMITGNSDFKVQGLAYSNQAQNAGYVSVGGKNRYVLYHEDPETLDFNIPTDFNLTPAGTQNNFQWQGVGCGQFTGTTIYRPAEVLYFDWNV